ncbi:MAG: hypothetical protein EXX96DRAFT_605647 [Benjaminiella poitrasii]|nr:MAG: hypothetical protein EXX96DRAFT_605647 [Benjaminiella poitrasii]
MTDAKKATRGRTWNLLIRSQTPYPLGHSPTIYLWCSCGEKSETNENNEKSEHNLHIFRSTIVRRIKLLIVQFNLLINNIAQKGTENQYHVLKTKKSRDYPVRIYVFLVEYLSVVEFIY